MSPLDRQARRQAKLRIRAGHHAAFRRGVMVGIVGATIGWVAASMIWGWA